MTLEGKRLNAPRARLSQFSSWFQNNDYNPSFNNRYSVSFTTPNILKGGRYLTGFEYELGLPDNQNCLNYYADSVNLPSKQVTTGSITNVGSTYNMQHLQHSVKSTFHSPCLEIIKLG